MNKNITLSVNENLYNKYRKYTKKNGLVVSKQFELFIAGELRK